MDMSKINVLVVDDDAIKSVAITRALKFNGIENVRSVGNQEKLWDKIHYGDKKIDLIVTDMQYPLESGADVDDEAGLKLIERMDKEGIDIPVIVCSSLNYSIPNVLGTVWYNELNDLNANFKEILGRLEYKAD